MQAVALLLPVKRHTCARANAHSLIHSFAFAQAVLSVLSNELLCVNTELRVIYDAYCVRQQGMPWGWGRPQHSAALTSAQLWQVMRDGNVLDPDCSLVDINIALAQVWHSLAFLSHLACTLYGMCVSQLFI